MFEHGDNKHGYGTCMSVEGDISPNALRHYFESKTGARCSLRAR